MLLRAALHHGLQLPPAVGYERRDTPGNHVAIFIPLLAFSTIVGKRKAVWRGLKIGQTN